MTLTETLLLGTFSSLLASCTFALFLYFVRPKIKISGQIAKNLNINKQLDYDIKVSNMAFRSAIDVRAELLLVKMEPVPGGEIQTTTKIALANDSVFAISKRDHRRFVMRGNLESAWESDGHLLFRVIARDGFSGVPHMFEKRFTDRAAIKEGKHVFALGKDEIE